MSAVEDAEDGYDFAGDLERDADAPPKTEDTETGAGIIPAMAEGGQSEPAVDGKKIMEKIATRTGARYFEAKKKDNLDEIYSQIAEELRGQYLLTYTPDKVDTDGGFHKIALKASNGDLIVVTREGYYAPTEASK